MSPSNVLLVHARPHIEHELRCFKRVLWGEPLRSWNLLAGVPSNHLIEDSGVIIIAGSPFPPTPDSPCYESALELIELAHAAGVPMIGICWGHQLMAIAVGGTVTVGTPEIGSVDISVTKDGTCELVLGTPCPPRRRFTANQAHEFVVDQAPPGAVRLAYSPDVKVQALRYSDGSLSFQFHPEMNRDDCVDRFKANRQNAAYLCRLMAHRVPTSSELTWEELVRVAEDGLFSDARTAELMLRRAVSRALKSRGQSHDPSVLVEDETA